MLIKRMGFILAVLGVVLTLCVPAVLAQKIQMKIASPFAPVTTNGFAPEWMFIEMKRRGAADGRLEMSYYGSAQLGGEMELFNKLRAGTIHLTINSYQVMSGFNKKVALGLLPFLFDTDEKAENFIKSPMNEALGKAMEDSHGVLSLGNVIFGRYALSGKKPIKTPDDLKGIKIRISESPVLLAEFKALGINATTTPWAEVYEVLKRGIVDGIDMSVEPVLGARLYEVVKYVSRTNHMYGWNFVFVNKKWWEGLPKDIQQFITDAVHDVCIMERYLALQREKQAIRDLKDKGINIIEMTDEERLPFIKLTLPVHKMYLNDIGIDLVKKTYEMCRFPYAKEVLEGK